MRKPLTVLCLMLICAGAAMAQTTSTQTGTVTTCPPGQSVSTPVPPCPPGQAATAAGDGATVDWRDSDRIGAAAETEAMADDAEIWDNLFLFGSGGYMKAPGEDSTPLGTGGFSYGMPLLPDWGVGLQFGGEARFRDNDPDYIGMLGFMQRDVPIGDMEGFAWSVQGIYMNSWLDADLWAVKPLVGMQLDSMNYVVLTGVWNIEDDDFSDNDVVIGEQELIDQAWLIWRAELADWNTMAEFGVGYEWSDVEEFAFGINLGWTLGPATSLNLYGQANLDGDYHAALAVAFDIGAEERNPFMHNIAPNGGRRFMPFPISTMPALLYETRETSAFGGGGGGF